LCVFQGAQIAFAPVVQAQAILILILILILLDVDITVGWPVAF
jgi:hypothetical protein